LIGPKLAASSPRCNVPPSTFVELPFTRRKLIFGRSRSDVPPQAQAAANGISSSRIVNATIPRLNDLDRSTFWRQASARYVTESRSPTKSDPPPTSNVKKPSSANKSDSVRQ